MFYTDDFARATLAAFRAVVRGFREAPGVHLTSREAGIFRGMRPAFVVYVVLPGVALAAWIWLRL